MLSDEEVRQAAEALHQAELTRTPMAPISETYPGAEVADAYRIGAAVTELKVAAGRVVKGHKVGLTSKAMRDATGATEPDYGTLFDDWFVLEGNPIDWARLNRPSVEVELAFVLCRELRGPGCTVAEVIQATDFVLPSIEIVDSRYRSRGPNMLVDSIADAASCGLIVLAGNPRRLTDLDIREVGASMTVNGVIQESGVARAVMDNPVSSVAWLVNKLAEFGVTPQPGHIIMSGSFLKITRFGRGDNVQALFSHGLGEVGFTCV